MAVQERLIFKLDRKTHIVDCLFPGHCRPKSKLWC